MKYVLLLILLCFSSCNNIFANQISMKDAMSEWKGLSIDSLRTIGNRCMLHTAGTAGAFAHMQVRRIWTNLPYLQPRRIWKIARTRDLQFWIKKKLVAKSASWAMSLPGKGDRKENLCQRFAL